MGVLRGWWSVCRQGGLVEPYNLNGLPRGQSGLHAVQCLIFSLVIKRIKCTYFKVKLGNTWTFMLKHLISWPFWPGFPGVWYVLVNVHEGETWMLASGYFGIDMRQVMRSQIADWSLIVSVPKQVYLKVVTNCFGAHMTMVHIWNIHHIWILLFSNFFMWILYDGPKKSDFFFYLYSRIEVVRESN